MIRSKVLAESLVSEVEWKREFLELNNRGVNTKFREDDGLQVESHEELGSEVTEDIGKVLMNLQ